MQFYSLINTNNQLLLYLWFKYVQKRNIQENLLELYIVENVKIWPCVEFSQAAENCLNLNLILIKVVQRNQTKEITDLGTTCLLRLLFWDLAVDMHVNIQVVSRPLVKRLCLSVMFLHKFPFPLLLPSPVLASAQLRGNPQPDCNTCQPFCVRVLIGSQIDTFHST